MGDRAGAGKTSIVADRSEFVKLTTEQLDLLGKRYRLSPRERQILALLFEGLPTNQAIAERLGTTSGAIQAGTRTLCIKVGAQSRHELVVAMMLAILRDLRAQQFEQFRRDAEATD